MWYVGAWEHVGHDAWSGEAMPGPCAASWSTEIRASTREKKEGRRGTIMRIKVTNEQMKGAKCHLCATRWDVTNNRMNTTENQVAEDQVTPLQLLAPFLKIQNTQKLRSC